MMPLREPPCIRWFGRTQGVLEKISAATATNRRFEIPTDFDFEKFSESAFNIIWGDPREVKIRFSSEQAPYVKERTWHPSQKIEDDADGKIVLTLHVANLWEVQRWLIGFGNDATVLAPVELREQIERECAKVVKRARVTRGTRLRGVRPI